MSSTEILIIAELRADKKALLEALEDLTNVASSIVQFDVCVATINARKAIAEARKGE